jgi:hypothetical protein
MIHRLLIPLLGSGLPLAATAGSALAKAAGYSRPVARAPAPTAAAAAATNAAR